MSTMSITDDYFSVTQAADYLGLTVGRIRQLLLAGDLTGEKFGDPENGVWMIPKKVIYSYAKIKPTTGRPRSGSRA